MGAAQELFSKVMQRSLMGFTQIFTFRQTAHVAITDAAPSLLRIEKRYAELTFSPSNKDRYFTDSEKVLELFGGLDGLATLSSERRATQFTNMVEAASLIYAHSLLDGIAYDLCVCISHISASSWRERIQEKKVSLKEALDNPPAELEKKLVSTYLENLEKESLLKKIDALFSVCRPNEGFNPFTGDESEYMFDRHRLKVLDDKRHELVHGLLPLHVSISPDEMEFMRKTALYLSALVSTTFSIKADSRQMIQNVA